MGVQFFGHWEGYNFELRGRSKNLLKDLKLHWKDKNVQAFIKKICKNVQNKCILRGFRVKSYIVPPLRQKFSPPGIKGIHPPMIECFQFPRRSTIDVLATDLP